MGQDYYPTFLSCLFSLGNPTIVIECHLSCHVTKTISSLSDATRFFNTSEVSLDLHTATMSPDLFLYNCDTGILLSIMTSSILVLLLVFIVTFLVFFTANTDFSCSQILWVADIFFCDESDTVLELLRRVVISSLFSMLSAFLSRIFTFWLSGPAKMTSIFV